MIGRLSIVYCSNVVPMLPEVLVWTIGAAALTSTCCSMPPDSSFTLTVVGSEMFTGVPCATNFLKPCSSTVTA